MNENDPPNSMFLVVHLRLSSFGRDGSPIFRGRVKSPRHLGPCGVIVNVDFRLMQNQLAFRKQAGHNSDVNVICNLFETMFRAERMNERDAGFLRPDLGR